MGENLKKTMRLDRFLAEMGKGTRSEIKALMKKGRVTVNGACEKRPERKICPQEDTVCLDGAAVEYKAWEYYMLNKPQGVVSATEDGRWPTVVGLIGEASRRDLFPVGRLDIDTEGLLLITNDGALAHDLLSPKKHVDKVYFARVAGKLPENAGKRFEEGIVLEDGTKTMAAHLEIQERGQQEDEPFGETEVKLTIREGKFHQVKRMFQALGCQVVFLKRLSMGPLTLDKNLKPGEYRKLTQEEILLLKNRQQ